MKGRGRIRIEGVVEKTRRKEEDKQLNTNKIEEEKVFRCCTYLR